MPQIIIDGHRCKNENKETILDSKNLKFSIQIMQTDVVKKTCKMCCMEIPKEARKCPYCQHFQSHSVALLYHPAFAVFCISIPFFVAIYFSFNIFNTGEKYETYKDQISITESQIAFGETKSGATVDVMGTIKNTSPVSWKEIQFHADFFNEAGKQIDVGEKESYTFDLPANQTTAFKVSFTREFPETNYSKFTVRVVTAKDANTRW